MSDDPRSLNSSDPGSVVTGIARLLRERFNQTEREALARELGVNPEDVKLRPETRDDFTWALIDYFERRGRLAELCAAVDCAAQQRGPFGAPPVTVNRTKPERRPAALLESATRLTRPRTVLLRVGVLLALGATSTMAVALFQPSATVQAPAEIPRAFQEFVSELTLNSLFHQETPRTLVALKPRGTPKAAQAYQDLCDKLTAVGGARVSCIPLENNGANLLTRAKEIGASLAVAVEQDATAHLVPLGRLAGDALLEGGVRPIDISRDGVAARLSPVLDQLSIIAASNFQARDAACLSLPTGSVAPGAQGVHDEISLLAVYTRQFALPCSANKHECALLDKLATCNPREPEPSLSCDLAMHLLVERCPGSSGAVAMLTKLTGPDVAEAYRNVAMLKLARQYCGKNASIGARDASRMLFELASRKEPCMTAALSEVATCLLPASASGELNASQADELRRLAELPLDSFDACGDTLLVARSIAGRALQHAAAGELRAAAAGFDAAYQRHRLDDYLLNRAESLLREGSTDAVKEASEILREGRATPRSSAEPDASEGYTAAVSVRRAVLSWIAANKRRMPKEDLGALWEQVVIEYAAAREGDIDFKTDKGIEELIDKVQGGNCVFDLLSRGHTGTKDGRTNAMRSCARD
jgi:hypothetical protein